MSDTNKDHLYLAKYVFGTTLILLVVILFLSTRAAHKAEQQHEIYTKQAQEQNNPLLCENIKSLQLSSQCYAPFIQKGFDCRAQAQTNISSACLIAQGVQLQDDLFCDAVLTGTNVPENLECRVSVFIQRYTNEGISDCCHIT